MVSSARSALVTAQRELETAKTSAAQSVRQARAAVEAAQVTLGAAQRSLASEVVHAQSSTDADVVAADASIIPLVALSFASERAAQAGQTSRAVALAAAASSAGRASQVLVLRDGQATARQIHLGINDERNVEVISGLEPDESVIVKQVVAPRAGAQTP